MAVATELSGLEALRQLLLGNHTPTDPTRLAGQQQVRAIVEDRISRGRKPAQTVKDCIVMAVEGVEREDLLSGEDDSAQSMIAIRCLCNTGKNMSLLADSVRQLLTSFLGSIQTPQGSVIIGGCTLVDEEEPEPDAPIDGSPDFQFEYAQVWKVTHTITSPTGLS